MTKLSNGKLNSLTFLTFCFHWFYTFQYHDFLFHCLEKLNSPMFIPFLNQCGSCIFTNLNISKDASWQRYIKMISSWHTRLLLQTSKDWKIFFVFFVLFSGNIARFGLGKIYFVCSFLSDGLHFDTLSSSLNTYVHMIR